MPPAFTAPTASTASDFPVRALLAWYRRHRRDLPWRPTRHRRANPYHVLVSEQMLQQTQVATVLPYFARFLEAFPTVEALSAADEQRVLKLWQGLGYYRRARNLHAAAQRIVAEHHGQVPRTAEELLRLPGLGRYSAGAVASVAYNIPAPILDGNVARVLARHDGIDTPVDSTSTRKLLWRRAEQLVRSAPHHSAGDFNQSLMELGALVCTPRSPTCPACPLRKSCVAHAEGRQDTLPVKTPKKKPVAVTHAVLAIERRGKLLFEQRSGNGLWSKMWQLPTLELDPDVGPVSRGSEATGSPTNHSTPPAASRPRLVRHAADRFGLTVTPPAFVGAFLHPTTHRTITIEVFRCTATGGRLKPKTGRWRNPQQLGDLPLAKPQVTALHRLNPA